MSVAEILGRINAKTMNYKAISPGFGSLTGIDVAHALSFVDGNGPRLIGRLRYADQPQFANALKHELVQALKAKAKAAKWSVGIIPHVAELAILTYCHPQRCRKCQGIGERMWGGRIVVCSRCHGSTWEPTKDVGSKSSELSRTYGEALVILGDWDRLCINGLIEGLKRC